jgi:hypothetical protein
MKFHLNPKRRALPPAVAHLIDELALLRPPFGLPVYVTAWQSVPFSLGLVRALLFSAMLLLCNTRAFARSSELQGAESPDGRFTVLVSESPHKRISYAIVALPSHTVLERFLSTYQPSADESPNWSWHEAAGAEVRWSPDSHYVAIDEDTYFHAGQMLLAEIRKGMVRSIPLPERVIIRGTHQKWDRYRIRIQEGWVSRRDLSLYLGGYAVRDYLPDGRHVSFNRSFEVRLQMHAGRATLISCHEVSKT